MGQIRTTNKRKKRQQRRRLLRTRLVARGRAVPLTLSRRAAVNAAVEARLIAEGRGLPHDPDGGMEVFYNYSNLSMPGFLLGVNEELSTSSGYSFTWNNSFMLAALQDSLRKLKARIDLAAE